MMARKTRHDSESHTSSANIDIRSMLDMIHQLRERVGSLEKQHKELLQEVNSIKKGPAARRGGTGSIHSHGEAHYACDMCNRKFSISKKLQEHRKTIHKAPYNI
jgi:predicted SprT family Zn-dependent metalloprotease